MSMDIHCGFSGAIANFIVWISLFFSVISTQEKFPRTENVPKISLLKVENFQLQMFFRRKICVGQSHQFTKCSFYGKFS
jgi:hypothetical protein